MPPATILSRFSMVRPRYEVPQADSLAWLAAAYAAADAGGEPPPDQVERWSRLLGRCACPPAKIANRSFAIPDLGTRDWADTQLYDVPRRPRGPGTGVRSELFAALVRPYLDTLYAADATAPDELIHVTCTGYVSPSPAQELVARRAWETRVTHAYQMGCYAAIPAVRLAAGAVASGGEHERVDIVHTELCSLHFDPSDHSMEQMVVHSLFADGIVRYSATRDDGRPGLRVRAVHERILPGTSELMSWRVGDHGMAMTLARDVPERIAGALRGFTTELFARGGLHVAALRDAVAAVHPGGPRIIDGVRDVLELSDAQVATSRAVLLERGNMSSATLPHVWMRLLADPAVPVGTIIPSFAFGPGLTICGALLEKC